MMHLIYFGIGLSLVTIAVIIVFLINEKPKILGIFVFIIVMSAICYGMGYVIMNAGSQLT